MQNLCWTETDSTDPQEGTLIKATIDFKGPVKGKHPYLLVVIDEFSRFPFAFPCRDVSARTVIECLTQLFCLFGMPGYIHSDRGSAFMSAELRKFLVSRNVATSLTTPYHPEGNSQCERLNSTLWKTVKLMLHSRGLHEEQWDQVLPDALHAIRSLLCTATNQTPHERFLSFERRSTVLVLWKTKQNPTNLPYKPRRNKTLQTYTQNKTLQTYKQNPTKRFLSFERRNKTLQTLFILFE